MSTAHVIGNLTREPELRFTASGQPVANFGVVENNRRKDESGNWVDGDPSFFDVSCWGTLAENVSQLAKGTRVVVVGRLQQRSWESDGQKRSKVEIVADEVGPSLRWATAEVTKKDGNGQSRQAARSGGSESRYDGGY